MTMNRVQELAGKIQLSRDEFIGEMRKRSCSEPTAMKIWQGAYEVFHEWDDNNIYLSNLRKAADILEVSTGQLVP